MTIKKLLVVLTLPILACGGLAESVSPTITPLPPPTVVPPTQTESQPEPPTAPPTQAPAASGFPDADQYEWRLIASGLNRPVDIQSAHDGSGRLFIVEKYGVIRVYQNGQLLDQPFLNIDDRVNDEGNEMGLLGLAFHPNHEQNGYFYVNYTGSGGHTRISRFQASGNSADPNSERVLMVVNQPYRNHNGGAVAFGPDGHLYIALGDGGSAGDPQRNGQNPRTLLGAILRIDVDNGDPYAIPPDNPFGNEVWAYGLRNPWRISFDRLTGDLWIGDVGQNRWEEIDYLPAGSPGGANFGWSIMEGNHPFDGSPQPGLLLPAAEYGRESGCSVTGGYVYRGAMPKWNGIYLFGDYCSGNIWGLILLDGKWQARALFEAGLQITSFGQDESGEIYLASDTGSVHVLAKK
jgi:glucose/arabinose dehydrogenase